MRITTRMTIDMATGEVLEHQWYEYEGLVELCKGEQEGVKNAELAQNAQFLKVMNDQLAMQKRFADPVFNNLAHYLSDQHGFTPEQSANLVSQFLDQQSQNFGQAASSTMTALRRRGEGGGDQPTGGAFTRGLEGLQGMQAASTSAGLRDINLADIQQALSNKFNTASIFSGLAPAFGNQAMGFGGLSQNAMFNAIKAGEGRPGILENFGNAFGGALGKSLGNAVGGGIGGVMGGGSFTGGVNSSGGGGCWIAATLYGGWFEPRTVRARAWLADWRERSIIGRWVTSLYYRYGQQAARKPWLVRLLKPLFDIISEER